MASNPALGDPYGSGTITVLRDGFVLLVVALYLIFNYGFMQVRVPPVAGGGVPIGEITLILCLASINYTTTLGRFAQTIYIAPFFIWWAYGIGRAVLDFQVHGAWAMRDAVHVIESLFLLVGFAVAARPEVIERIFTWLPRILAITVVYTLLQPVQDVIWSISPTITAGNGYEVPIIGMYANSGIIMMLAAFYLIIFKGNRLIANVIAIGLIGYALFLFQSRTLYLILIAGFAFLAWHRRGAIGTAGMTIYVMILAAAAIPVMGIQFQGRIGGEISLEFLFEHFLTIFGIGSDTSEAVTSAASGVDRRLEWWLNIYERMIADPFKLLFGLGYGIALTDMGIGEGIPVREPHNSYISVIARLGVIGAIAWLWLHALLIRAWLRCYRLFKDNDDATGRNRLAILFCFFICIWVLSIGEDGFEKPYNTIPYYFAWGVVLRMTYNAARERQSQPMLYAVETD